MRVPESTPNTPGAATPETRRCDVCGEPMTYVGSVPRKLAHSTVTVFRCYHCNNVASVELSP